MDMEVHLRTGLEVSRGVRVAGRVMGLDLEPQNVGISILTDTGLPLRSATISHKLKVRGGRLKSVQSEADKVARLIQITDQVVGIARTFQIAAIAIECPTVRFGRYMFERGELSGCVKTQLWLATHNLPYLIAATSARKVVLGFGGAKKDEVQKVLTNVGIDFETEHEADAYIIARWMFEVLRKET